MRRRDPDEFRHCFDEHWSTVCGCLRRRGASAQTEDLAAETFAIAWRKWRSVPSDPLPWLLRTAINLLANARRKAARHPQPLELLDGDGAASAAAHDVLESRESARGVLSVLAGLRETDREAILLIAWDGLAPAQAAAACGCSPAAFRVRLHRARAALRAALADESTPSEGASWVPS